MIDGDGATDGTWSLDGERFALTSARSLGGLYDETAACSPTSMAMALQDLQPIFSDDGSLLAASDYTGRVFVWDASTGERRRMIAVTSSPTAVPRLVFLDNERLATVLGDHRVAVWDAVTGVLLASADVGVELHAVAVSPDGHTLATGGVDGVIRTFDAHTLTPGMQLEGHRDAVVRLAFTRGARLYSGSINRTTRSGISSARR